MISQPTNRLAVLALAALLVPLIGPGGDAAAPLLDDPTCVKEYLHSVGMICRLPNGLYLGHYDDGTAFTTHGPDPIPSGGDMEMQNVNERQPRCATDYYQHVLYGRPADGQDATAGTIDTIRRVIRQMNWLLNEDALESGGVTADYKVRCDAAGFIRVDSFVVPSSSSDFNAIVSAARAAGFTNSRADYTIFYAGTSANVCGVGHISYDDRPGANNANNFGGDYGVTYQNCWTGRTPMHENGHNQGAVQLTAPDSDGAGHCIEGRDIMCYPTSQVLVLCGDRMHYDCDHDTYFHADPPSGSWLATHWNIGSRVNRFIAFGDTDPAPDNDPPVAHIAFTLDDRNLTASAAGSADPDGDTLHYQWSLGDGTSATTEVVTHTYQDPGNHRLALTVSDAKGGIDHVSVIVTVLPDVEPRVQTLHFDGRIGCSVGLDPIRLADICRGADAQQQFDVALDPGVTDIHVELRWGPADGPAGVFTAAEMTYAWLSPAIGDGASGPSPVIGDHSIAYDNPIHINGRDTTIDVRASGLSGLVKDQPFEMCVVVMYGDAALPQGACTE